MSATNIEFFPIVSKQVSTDTGHPVSFVINNNYYKTVSLFWVNRDGIEIPYAKVGPNQEATQLTVTTHMWLVRSDDGKVAFKFYPEGTGIVGVSTLAQPYFQSNAERMYNGADGVWSTAQGYGVINAAKSLGVPEDAPALNAATQSNYLALNTMSAPSAWKAGFTGKGVIVAVIDAGIAPHAEINGKIVGGYDFYEKDNDPTPDNGAYSNHALGVASIIAASHAPHAGMDTMGVAPDAGILNVRVGSSMGSSTDTIAAGIRYAVDNGAKVICMPLQNNASNMDTQLASAVNYAYKHNVTTVIIGGNFSNYGPTGPALIAKMNSEAIGVGNLNAETMKLFPSSNMAGPGEMPWVTASSTGYQPTANGGYAYYHDGGTSFAGPYVAGLAALLYQQSPNATAKEIMSKITKGASFNKVGVPGNLNNASLPLKALIGNMNRELSVNGGRLYEKSTGTLLQRTMLARQAEVKIIQPAKAVVMPAPVMVSKSIVAPVAKVVLAPVKVAVAPVVVVKPAFEYWVSPTKKFAVTKHITKSWMVVMPDEYQFDSAATMLDMSTF